MDYCNVNRTTSSPSSTANCQLYEQSPNSNCYFANNANTNFYSNEQPPSPSSPCSPLLSSSASSTSTVNLTLNPVQQAIQLRFLNPSDYETVKGLCEHWFPVEYPEKWFEAITSDTTLFSLAASYQGRIIGLIVSELKSACELGKDDKDLLSEGQKSTCSVAYILSLGVVEQFRRQGIASLLLSSLLNHLSTQQCKAVYLHVLTTNQQALKFYEKHQFRVHKFLPYYYSIGGKARDGFTYVLYLNGGHAPWELPEYIQHICELTVTELCSIPGWCLQQMRRVLHAVLTFIR